DGDFLAAGFQELGQIERNMAAPQNQDAADGLFGAADQCVKVADGTALPDDKEVVAGLKSGGAVRNDHLAIAIDDRNQNRSKPLPELYPGHIVQSAARIGVQFNQTDPVIGKSFDIPRMGIPDQPRNVEGGLIVRINQHSQPQSLI